MTSRLLADLVLLLHAAFVVFVVAGALLVMRWPGVAWVHVPAALWGAGIEFLGWICPLTPLENYWRRMAGGEGYPGGFVEHYVFPVLYPDGLTRNVQFLLGALVLALNGVLYGVVLLRVRRAGRQECDRRVTSAGG